MQNKRKFDRLKDLAFTWLLSSGQEFDKMFLESKHILKVYFKPSRKNKDIVFLPVHILSAWLKILHLIVWPAQ